MARPRKQTYTMEMYLKKMKNGDIDNSADTQRMLVKDILLMMPTHREILHGNQL